MRRREFLKTAGVTVIGAPMVFSQNYSLFAQGATSILAIAQDAGAATLILGNTQNTKVTSFTTNDQKVTAMVDAAIRRLTGISDIARAWESLFPAGKLTTATKIAIKANFSYGASSGVAPDPANGSWGTKYCPWAPKVAVIEAIVSGLTR